MATTIITKNGSGAPTTDDLSTGELAIDLTNKRLYSYDGTSVIELGVNTASSLNVTGTVTADGLTVESSGDPTSITLRHTGNTSGLVIKNFSGAESQLVNVDNGPMVFKTNDTERMRIDSTGNLRVGAGNTFEPTLQFTNSGRVVGNPGYSFSGDLDTGMFNPSAQGTIAFANNGAESMRIDSIGNVGIGTDSPVSPLTTSIGAGSAGSLNNQIAMTHSGASNSYHIKTIRAAADDEPAGLAFVENTTERMRIDSSGNVGIGTSPSFYQGSGLEIERAGIATVRLQNTTSGKSAELKIDTDLTLETINTGSDILFNTGATERVRIDSSGNVHIGAGTASTANLSIITSGQAGGIQLNRNTSGSPTSGQSLGSYAFKGLDSANSNAAAEAMIEAVAAETHTGSTAATNMIFYTKGTGTGPGSAPTPRMTLDASGNLLVGVTSTTIPGIGNTTAGVSIRGDDGSFFSRSLGSGDTNNVVSINRSTADGPILGFQKDGTSVGTIGNNTDFYIASQDGVGLRFTSTQVLPCSESGAIQNGSRDLGSSSGRFQDLYLSGDAYVGQVKFPSVSYDDRSLGIDSNGFYLYNNDDSRYDLVVDDDGRLLIGKTVVSATGAGTELRGTQAIIGKTDSGTVNGIFFNHASTYVGGLNYSDTATSLQTSSDERLKENITDAEDAGSTIDAMQVRQFDWKVNGSHQDYGFIAQELEPVFDYAVHTAEDDMQTKSVDYASLVPMLVKEIQQLRARVAQLEGAN